MQFSWPSLFLVSMLIMGVCKARMWNSLSFGPDFEKNWTLDEAPLSNNENERLLKTSRVPPSKMLTDKSMKSGELNRKNCLFSALQCSYYFKRSARSTHFM